MNCQICNYPPDEHGFSVCPKCGRIVCCFCYIYTAKEAKLLEKNKSLKLGRCITCKGWEPIRRELL